MIAVILALAALIGLTVALRQFDSYVTRSITQHVDAALDDDTLQ